MARPYRLALAEVTVSGGDNVYCWSFEALTCDATSGTQTLCCDMRLDKVEFLINGDCIQSIYNGNVNGKGISPSYTTYDRAGATYTTAKLRLNVALSDAPSSKLCFTLRRGICASLQDLCAGPDCLYTVAEDPGAGATCCPLESGKWW
ncbi:hypothetical protein TSOC_005912 [Tetrabaena socialis]|uniref:Pherophorin domain-containing protein n=1 Tax=Tetrabaena socialis TaxID=47790 RepID=A0A2J8A510_9CHLO|nr:hypothetical protein TSOC_005912 [Tetrabaena socialis]|eukprot:PNH07614.1 hypothetical protein TSOC_005912 [Tetrabaena socialis]